MNPSHPPTLPFSLPPSLPPSPPLQALNIQVPFLFKHAIDSLSNLPSAPAALHSAAAASPALSSLSSSLSPDALFALAASPPALLLAYGCARIGASACNGGWGIPAGEISHTRCVCSAVLLS